MGYRPPRPPPRPVSRPSAAFPAPPQAPARALRPAPRRAVPPETPFSIETLVARTPDMAFFLDGLAEDSTARLIMTAAVEGDAARLKLLLEKPDALPDFQNAFGLSPLAAAAARGHAAAVDTLAAHPLVNLARQDSQGMTALHYAARFDHPAVAGVLLAHRAPFDIAAKDGKLPHDCAAGHDAEEVFWQDRDFARFMKTREPENPRLQPPPPETGQEPAPQQEQARQPAKEKEETPLQDAFIRTLIGVGLELKDNPALDVRARLNGLMAKMDEGEFRDAFAKIRATKVDYDWDDVFVRAAGEGNAAVMTILQETSRASSATLARALSAAIETHDRRDAVHHLLMWGADPEAAYETAAGKHRTTIHRQAYRTKRVGAFEEMALWGGLMGGVTAFDEYELAAKLRGTAAQAAYVIRKDTLGPKAKLAASIAVVEQSRLLLAVQIWRTKRELKGMRTKKLRAVFNAAVDRDSIGNIMAAYAEAREDRLFRGRVEMERESGAAAIARALLHKRYEFARMLVGDGYHLKDAPAWMRHKIEDEGSATAKSFARDHLSGKIAPRPIEEIGKTRLSPGDAALYTGGLYGYGRFGI